MSSRLGPDRPFPGLRPYAEADHDWFFGRTRQTLALYRLLDLARLVAVVGGSGSGKSSPVRAGLLPLLAKETAGEGGRRWRWWELRPGDAPIARLADALASEQLAADERVGRLRAALRERIDFTLRRSSFGLIDALRELDPAPSTTPLVLVDQFEELFRFADLPGTEAARAGRREEATAFVQLLLEAARSADPPIRVVLTMRSDYLGDTARFHGLPEAVTASQFLVPSLTRDQREQAIRGPVERAGGSIADNLVECLLNDSSEEQDQLPVLQHALMRTWQLARQSDRRELSLDFYLAVGGTTGAISRHANELLKGPELQGRALAVEQVFRALAELDRQGRGIRRPLPFAQLVAETGVPEDDVRTVVDRFRRDDCSFLVAPFVEDRPLAGTDVVDIGHEALIRGWARMSREEAGARVGWLWSEASDGRTYRGLLTVIDGAAGRGRATLPFGQLSTRTRWWQERPRSRAWAERYEGRLAEIERLFADSRRRSWLGLGAVALVGLAFLGAATFVLYSWRETTKRADETRAALIWAKLDFEDTNDPRTEASARALWDLATGTAAVRDAFLGQLAQDRYQVGTLAQAPASIARAFGLGARQAEIQRLLTPVLDGLRRTTSLSALVALAEAVQALGAKLAPIGAGSVIEASCAVLAGADDPGAAAAFARAIALTLAAESGRSYVAGVVELLKWPTTAGPATDALLEVLHERVPGAPGKEAGLDATVRWVAKTFPDIDLDSPPTYPVSGSTGGAW